MFKKRALVITLFICIMLMGVMYGKWTDKVGLELSAKSGSMSFNIDKVNEFNIKLASNSGEYFVEPLDMEITGNDEKTLLIKADTSKISILNGRVNKIELDYGVNSDEKNTITEFEIDNPEENVLLSRNQDIASQGDLSGVKETKNFKNIISWVKSDTEGLKKAAEIKQIICDETGDGIEYAKGDTIEFDIKLVLSQNDGQQEGKANIIDECYCLWAQSIKLHCKIIFV